MLGRKCRKQRDVGEFKLQIAFGHEIGREAQSPFQSVGSHLEVDGWRRGAASLRTQVRIDAERLSLDRSCRLDLSGGRLRIGDPLHVHTQILHELSSQPDLCGIDNAFDRQGVQPSLRRDVETCRAFGIGHPATKFAHAPGKTAGHLLASHGRVAVSFHRIRFQDEVLDLHLVGGRPFDIAFSQDRAFEARGKCRRQGFRGRGDPEVAREVLGGGIVRPADGSAQTRAVERCRIQTDGRQIEAERRVERNRCLQGAIQIGI